MKNYLKKGIALTCFFGMFAGAFAGCSSKGTTQQFPTPTPRTENSGKETGQKGTATAVPVTPSVDTEAALKSARSYEDVYRALEKVEEQYRSWNGYWTTADGAIMIPEMEVVEDSAVDFDASPTVSEEKNESAAGGLDFSQTNVQVAGIDESDIIKTDGRYFYIFDMRRSAIYIVSADKGEMALVSEISVSDKMHGNETGREMYLVGDRLVLLVSGYRGYERNEEIAWDGGDIAFPVYYDEHAVTMLYTYDVSNKEKPVLVSTLEQDGSLVSSRCTGGKIYTVSSHRNYEYYYAVDEAETDEEKFSRYIPKVEGTMVAPDCIYISEEPVSKEFLVVTAMSPEAPEQYADVKSMLASGDDCYVSPNYIYVTGRRWQTQEISYDRTEVYRFSYTDGVIAPAGQVTVKGRLDDQFSVDEYEGNLRIVTTVSKDWKDSNSLYIYDSNLALTGSIENLAPEEHIKSARLMGDVGYFVTFRQTDPLFSVDLSDPTNPKVLGELKIPGFSSYLHPYGDGLLLGIGYDADEQTGQTKGVKLSMFDVSDPANVKEVHKLLLPEFSSTGAADNHKAVLVNAEKNIIGLPARGYSEKGEYNVYLVFEYHKDKGFVQTFSEGYTAGYNSEIYDFKYEFLDTDCRGAYIEDVFYMINPSYEVKAFDMMSWKTVGRVGLVKELEERAALLEKIKETNPEPIVIELTANPSTGYNWTSTTEGDAVRLSTVETVQTEPKEEQKPGTPVLERYTFEVNDIGTTKVMFEYARPWESKTPLHTIVYEIKVDENLVATIESVDEW